VAIVAVSQNGNALEFASAELKAEKMMVMAAAAKYGAALQHALAELKADKEVVMVAVSQTQKEFVALESPRRSSRPTRRW
jgi:hypothetical protein